MFLHFALLEAGGHAAQLCCKRCAQAAQHALLPRSGSAVLNHRPHTSHSLGSLRARRGCAWTSCSCMPAGPSITPASANMTGLATRLRMAVSRLESGHGTGAAAWKRVELLWKAMERSEKGEDCRFKKKKLQKKDRGGVAYRAEHDDGDIAHHELNRVRVDAAESDRSGP